MCPGARRTHRARGPREPVAVGRRDVLEQLLLELQHSLRAAIEATPGLGRLDATARSVEQLLPETLLERPNLEADGGLRDAEALGGLREAPPLDDRAKGGKLAGVHIRTAYRGR